MSLFAWISMDDRLHERALDDSCPEELMVENNVPPTDGLWPTLTHEDLSLTSILSMCMTSQNSGLKTSILAVPCSTT